MHTARSGDVSVSDSINGRRRLSLILLLIQMNRVVEVREGQLVE